MTESLLHARALALDAPGGRPLFRDLSIALDRGDRVALVGRNGVGKSSLLAALAGDVEPARGRVICRGRRLLVPQLLDGAGSEQSPGELRRTRLAAAIDARPDVLLLDEPTHDLDELNIDWLIDQLSRFRGTLVAVSHDRRLLRGFGDFFIAAETGCRHFHGSFEALLEDMRARGHDEELRYARELQRLTERERRNATLSARRRRKKNVGRVRELGRGTPRIRLNAKRSYAQEKQGKRNRIQAARIGAARTWAKAMRRALAVELPLELALPALPAAGPVPIIRARELAAHATERLLFERLSLDVSRERVAIQGANGSGKSTLLSILVGERAPDAGRARTDATRLGYVAQNADNWCIERSLLDELEIGGGAHTPDALAEALRAHRFPFALAERPLGSLSPGERLRAALICLCCRRPAPELLVLDEPTDHLDLPATAALEALLSAWPGGLIVVSHDEEFLRTIGIETRIELALHGGTGGDVPHESHV